MKKNIGSALALYPTPTVVVGAMNGEKPAWTLVAHVGIIGHDRILISLASAHYINQFINEKKSCLSTLWTRECSRKPTS